MLCESTTYSAAVSFGLVLLFQSGFWCSCDSDGPDAFSNVVQLAFVLKGYGRCEDCILSF